MNDEYCSVLKGRITTHRNIVNACGYIAWLGAGSGRVLRYMSSLLETATQC